MVDEDKNNNLYTNLEWVTPKENNNHGSVRERIALSNQNNPAFSKVVQQYDLENNLINTYPSCSEAARRAGFDRSSINKASRNKYCSGNIYNGFIWSQTPNKPEKLKRVWNRRQGAKRDKHNWENF